MYAYNRRTNNNYRYTFESIFDSASDSSDDEILNIIKDVKDVKDIKDTSNKNELTGGKKDDPEPITNIMFTNGYPYAYILGDNNSMKHLDILQIKHADLLKPIPYKPGKFI